MSGHVWSKCLPPCVCFLRKVFKAEEDVGPFPPSQQNEGAGPGRSDGFPDALRTTFLCNLKLAEGHLQSFLIGLPTACPVKEKPNSGLSAA